jgi:DNA-binding NarL/FixJ family response regulator
MNLTLPNDTVVIETAPSRDDTVAATLRIPADGFVMRPGRLAELGSLVKAALLAVQGAQERASRARARRQRTLMRLRERVSMETRP